MISLLFVVGAAAVAQPGGGGGGGAAAVPLNEVSAERMKGYVEQLEGFGTRHTLSDAVSKTRGIGAARTWIKEMMDSFVGAGGTLRVSFEEFDAPKMVRMPEGGRVVNVLGVLPGTKSPGRAYYVVGHYDSRNGDGMDASGEAPGANDDASGTAVVIELARVLAGRPLESTVVFLCAAGEEQGLVGAKYHAERIAAEKPWTIGGVLNNDIVGDPSPGGDAGKKVVRVFSEGLPRAASAEEYAAIRSNAAESDSPSRELARFVAGVGATLADGPGVVKPMLVFRQDRFLRGGDHSAFNDAGFAAVRFTTLAEDYSRQHQNVSERDGKRYGDVSAFVDAAYLAGVARLNLAALVSLANAPSTPGRVRIITKDLGVKTLLKWAKSPEDDVAGYEVVTRATTAADWETVIDVGDVVEKELDINKDNVLLGVRAYDRDGNRSVVGFAWASKD